MPPKKPIAGEPFAVGASQWAGFMDAAAAHQAGESAIGQKPQPGYRDADLVLIRNDSGEPRARFDILGIDGIVIEPANDEHGFCNAPILNGITPDVHEHTGKFVILSQWASKGEVVPAWIAGVCVARVDVTNENHGCAYLKHADCEALASGDGGEARVLWRESGTGRKWALVLVGRLEMASAIACVVSEDFADTDNMIPVEDVTVIAPYAFAPWPDGEAPTEIENIHEWMGDDGAKVTAIRDFDDGSWRPVQMTCSGRAAS